MDRVREGERKRDRGIFVLLLLHFVGVFSTTQRRIVMKLFKPDEGTCNM